MKKSYLFSIGLILVGAVVFYFTTKNQNKSISPRDQYVKNWNNSPYSKTIFLNEEQREEAGIPPNGYYEQEYLLKMNPITGKPEPEKLLALQERLNKENPTKNVPGYDDEWEEKGPYNVPGRTRAVMYDPNDATHKRVFAGGVSGGLFVNDDIETYSSSWQRLDIPENLAVSSITYDVNNPQNMFVGTGESYIGGQVNGNGVWRSTDGGTTWEHVIGGSTGSVYFQGDAVLTVNSPAGIAGDYAAVQSDFGGPDPAGPITADLVIVDDGSSNPTWGCNSLVNASEVNGKIAVIERGECYFVDKVMNAQNAGAVAVVMVNNVYGPPIIMGGSSSSINIPSFMISKEDGEVLMNAINNGTVNATFDFTDTDEPGGVYIPGIFHINDIKTRDNGGTTEIYMAASDVYGTGGYMGSSTFGLYKSTDNGDTWQKLTLPNVPGHNNEYVPNKILIDPDNNVWITTVTSATYDNGGGTVLKSTDGNTFTVKYTLPGGRRTEIAFSSTDADKIYMLAAHPTSKVKILKTTDGFATNPVELPKPVDHDSNSIPANDFTRGQAFYDLTIAVDPNDDDIVYVGGVDSFRSDDGGQNWNQMSEWFNISGLNAPYVHADIHNIIFSPVNSDQGLITSDGGVFYALSFSGAANEDNTAISPRMLHYNTTQFYKGAISQAPAPLRILGGAQDNGTNFKNGVEDGENMFFSVFGGDGTYCFIDKDNEYMVVSLPYNNFFRLSAVGGYQATLIQENSGFFVNPAELDDNLDILYTNASTSSQNKIARLKNITDSPQRYDLTNAQMLGYPSALKVSPYTTDHSTLFVGTTRGNVFKITNADASPNWSLITNEGFYGSVSAITFGSNENEIIITYYNYGVKSIWYTDDGGLTWQDKEGDLPDLPVNDVMMNPMRPQEVILATDLGIWMTKDFFASNPHWERAQNGMQNVKVTSLEMREEGHIVLATTFGRGFFTGKFTQFAAGTEDEDFSNEVNVYPNASNGTFFIRSTQDYSNTNIEIFDMQGKQLWKDTRDLSGEPVQITTSLPQGVYFLHLQSGDQNLTKKIIIQ